MWFKYSDLKWFASYEYNEAECLTSLFPVLSLNCYIFSPHCYVS